VIDGPLYVAALKIYPQSVQGTYRRIKWILLCLTLGVYYFLPFVRWYRGPNEPSQAVLVDLANRRFYFFFIEIWPQEVYYLTGLLIIAAMTLFLMNALAGRVWCGYLCPQTVWTDLFYAVERWVEGDRRTRMAQDAAPWTVAIVGRKAVKHFLWLMIAWWTGGAWVLYFSDAPTLVSDLLQFRASADAYIWIGILTLTTYVLAGFMKEQVCLYMCPWPRIQAALTDENALNVTYRYDRGEPRTSLKKAGVLREHGEVAGDCIDCNQCVAVCPTGVDIRQGASLGCIQCGLCIDACDTVMTKIGRETRLIAYDTDVNIQRRQEGKANIFRPIRARTILYAVLIVVIGVVMLYSLLSRQTESISVIHDRNPIYVRLSTGELRNAFTVRLANKKPDMRRFQISVSGLEGARVDVIGGEDAAGGAKIIEVGPDRTREVRLLVTTAAKLPDMAALPIVFEILSLPPAGESLKQGVVPEVALAKDFFRGP